MDKNSRLTQKALRRNTPRLTQEQKKSLLDFLDGDDDSRKVGIAMIESYLAIHPNEKHFRKKYITKKKIIEPFVWKDNSWINSWINTSVGVQIQRPPSYVTYSTIELNDIDTTYEIE